jgi:hypothetical protein
MKTISLLVLSGALCLPALAMPSLPLTYTDVYGVGSPDVLGDTNLFDIDKVIFSSFDSTTKKLSIEIYFNYGGYNNTTQALDPFSIGYPFEHLSVGDLLFYSGSNIWAVALNAHDGFVAGNLYQVTGTQTAKHVLGFDSDSTFDADYRPTQAVWGDGAGKQLIGAGTVTSSLIGSGPEVLSTVTFTTDLAFQSALDSASFSFASATCGNDVITGATPEPAALTLIGGGLLGLGFLQRRKK